MTDEKKPEEAAAKTAETATKAAAETVKTAAAETAKAAEKTSATTAATASKTTAAAKKAAPRKAAPKKTTAAKPAAKKAAPARKAAPAPAKAAASTAKTAASTAKTAKASADQSATAALALTGEIGETIAEFVRMRMDDNMDFVNELSRIESPTDLIKAQQAYFEDAAKAYTDHFTALNDKYQDMFVKSFEPFMSGFKDQADQWRRLAGV